MHTKSKILLFVCLLAASSTFAQWRSPNAIYKSGMRLDNYVVNQISNDVTLASNNSQSLVTEHAVKTYIDSHSTGGGTGGGDMTQSVYDPTGVNGDAFDYANFHNRPTIPSNTNQLTNGANFLIPSDTTGKWLPKGFTDLDTLVYPVQYTPGVGTHLSQTYLDSLAHDTLVAPIIYTPGIGIHFDGAFGTATLSSGTITVSCTAVTSSSRILITVKTPGGTQGFLSVPSSGRTAGTSFLVNSTSSTETSTFDWEVINP